jgi:SAM-dependent methyltransferase
MKKINFGEYLTDTIRTNFIKSLFEKSITFDYLLDLGCGQKPYKKIYEKKVLNHIGIEVSSTSHGNAYVDLIYDGKNIPFEDATFDVVLCTEVLEHVEQPQLFLTEINRVMKKNGILILTTPFLQLLHEMPFDYNRFTPFELKRLIEKTNFSLEKIIGISSATGFIFSIMNRLPLKIMNKLAKWTRIKLIYSIYNPLIFLFIFLPQWLYLQIGKHSFENVYDTKTAKSYGLIARKCP